MRELILLRCHNFDAPARRLFDFLHETSGRDVVLICEEGRAAVDAGKGRAKIGLDRAHVEAMGLHAPRNFAWLCGDYFLFTGMQSLPNYDRYWMIEYDVRLGFAQARQFFDRFADPTIDFLAFMMREAGPNWSWYEPMRHFSARVHACLFPIVAVGRKALQHAFAERRRMSEGFAETLAENPARRWPNDESFMSTVLNEGGFRCSDMNAMDRRLATSRTYRFGLPMSDLRIAEMPPTGMVYHPVHAGAHFLRKLDGQMKMHEASRISLARIDELFTEELRQDVMREGGAEVLAAYDRRIAGLRSAAA